ncbi:uncharacterized protein PAC_18268 [Phialocephala subalpina]|uniref:Uncharacterized protein n=1 Tax=Phialocephala subalpina TaxID=576137 RepID=A0A1L7XTM0_9HELO|nr:uncharacterized protein PAC_18268 [Phialocephala subalpina]
MLLWNLNMKYLGALLAFFLLIANAFANPDHNATLLVERGGLKPYNPAAPKGTCSIRVVEERSRVRHQITDVGGKSQGGTKNRGSAKSRHHSEHESLDECFDSLNSTLEIMLF